MNGKRISILLKVVCFLTILGFVLNYSFGVLKYKDTGGGGGFERLEQLPKESADVIFFGNSHCHCTINHSVLWNDYGIAGYTFTAGSQTIDSTASFVEYALSVQSPKVIAVEISGILADSIQSDYVDVYRNLVGMEWSIEYIKRALSMSKTVGDTFDTRFELITKYPLVHNRYKELTKSDFILEEPYMMGYRGSFENISYEKPNVIEWVDENPIPDDVLTEVQKIVDSAESKGVEVLFWASPFVLDEPSQERFNAFEKYAFENNLNFINYNNFYDELGIDFSIDYRDTDHVNNSGACKVTKDIAKVLGTEYELPDRRGDERYYKWEQNSQFLADRALGFNLSVEVDFNTYARALNLLDDRYVILMKLNGNYSVFSEMYGEGLEGFGISNDDYLLGGAFILKGKTVVEHLEGIYSRCLETPNGEIHIDSDTNDIITDNEIYDVPDNGIGILVYDMELGYIVDVGIVDVYYIGNVVKHLEKE